MKKLSAATETKLITAIEKTAAMVNQGERPSQAIAKVAVDMGIPPGNINLLVHAYNTGRTAKQRQEGGDVFEKSADFEMADASEVVELMYPTRVKTAAARFTDATISTEYAYSPRGLLDRRIGREKAASSYNWALGTNKPQPYPTDPNTRMKRAAASVERLNKAVDEARRLASQAMDKMASSFCEISDYFRSPTSLPIPVVRENVMLLHGDHGTRVMDEIVKVSPALTKLANHNLGSSLIGVRGQTSFAQYANLPAVGQPYDQIARLIAETRNYNRLKVAYEQIASENARQAEVLLRPFVQSDVSPSILGPSSGTEKQAIGNFNPLQALGTYSLLKNTLGQAASSIKAPDEKALVQKNLNVLTDPEHEEQLRAINTQSMLHNMLLNDPVISGYDPNDVTDAFNEIVQISPRAADQQLLMQSVLRKRLQQGVLDQFEVDQLLGMEDKLRRRDTSDFKGGGSDGSVL